MQLDFASIDLLIPAKQEKLEMWMFLSVSVSLLGIALIPQTHAQINQAMHQSLEFI